MRDGEGVVLGLLASRGVLTSLERALLARRPAKYVLGESAATKFAASAKTSGVCGRLTHLLSAADSFSVVISVHKPTLKS